MTLRSFRAVSTVAILKRNTDRTLVAVTADAAGGRGEVVAAAAAAAAAAAVAAGDVPASSLFSDMAPDLAAPEGRGSACVEAEERSDAETEACAVVEVEVVAADDDEAGEGEEEEVEAETAEARAGGRTGDVLFAAALGAVEMHCRHRTVTDASRRFFSWFFE
jgi:hypothetical protein